MPAAKTPSRSRCPRGQGHQLEHGCSAASGRCDGRSLGRPPGPPAGGGRAECDLPALPAGSGATINNPLKSDSVTGILESILDLVAVVGSIVVVFFIIWSGYKLVMARGNPGEMTKAKDMLLATVIGGAILLGADIIANVVINTVKTTVDTTAP